MRQLLRRLLFRNSGCLLLVLLFHRGHSQQSVNYVSNGSFEEIASTPGYTAKYWRGLDTAQYYGVLFTKPLQVPKNPFGFQWPKYGNNYFGITPYCPSCIGNNRGYPCNRLKGTLSASTVYCVSFYVSLTNQSTYGIDAIGAFFGDNMLDTITQCTQAITFLIPQVSNPLNNPISDTLNWSKVSGTFTASGNEKYLLLGNFKSDSNTNTTLSNSINLPANFAEYFVDGVSVLEMNLPAFAGNDTTITPGDSAFIGRTPDFGLDDACQWFKFPNMATTFDTVAGLWVKPTATTTYVVRQHLWCSGVKWDTVVVYVNPVGLTEKLNMIKDGLRIFPVPANDKLILYANHIELMKDYKSLYIYNNYGEVLREEKIFFVDQSVTVRTADLPEGIYSLHLRGEQAATISKRFVVQR